VGRVARVGRIGSWSDSRTESGSQNAGVGITTSSKHSVRCATTSERASPPRVLRTGPVEWHRALRDIEARVETWVKRLTCTVPGRGHAPTSWPEFVEIDVAERRKRQEGGLARVRLKTKHRRRPDRVRVTPGPGLDRTPELAGGPTHDRPYRPDFLAITARPPGPSRVTPTGFTTTATRGVPNAAGHPDVHDGYPQRGSSSPVA